MHVGLLAVYAGSPLLGAALLYLAYQSDDEDRFYEDINLDTTEVALNYTLGVHRDEIAEYYQSLGLLYNSAKADELHEYLMDDLLYERELLAEIYEFPLSTIASNNYYLVPSDQRNFVFFHHKFQKYVLHRWPNPRKKASRRSLFFSKTLYFSSVCRPSPKLKSQWVSDPQRKELCCNLLRNRWPMMKQLQFFGWCNSVALSRNTIKSHKPILQALNYH